MLLGKKLFSREKEMEMSAMRRVISGSMLKHCFNTMLCCFSLSVMLVAFLMNNNVAAQIDTIDGTGEPFVGRVHLNDGSDINLDRIGLVENKILYGSQTIDGNDVMIVDLTDLLNVKLKGTIQRTGSTSEEYFRFIKQGNTVFFNDSNYLRIYDVANLGSPVSKHSVEFEREVITININNDTLFTGNSGAPHLFKNFFKIYYDYANQLLGFAFF